MRYFSCEFLEKGLSYLFIEWFASAELFEEFIRLRIAYFSELSLYGFSDDLEALGELLFHELAVRIYLWETFSKTIVGNEGVTKSGSLISEYCGVREISLLSADRQFASEVVDEGVGKP